MSCKKNRQWKRTSKGRIGGGARVSARTKTWLTTSRHNLARLGTTRLDDKETRRATLSIAVVASIIPGELPRATPSLPKFSFQRKAPWFPFRAGKE
jgi:hypothetical protein